MTQVAYIFCIVFYALYSVLTAFISGPVSLLGFFGALFAYSLIFFGVSYLWKKIRKRPLPRYRQFLPKFLYRIAVMLSIFIAIVGGFCVYQNTINPAKLPLYTLTNGKQTIQFQAMSHIASKDFYSQVEQNIIKAKEDGAVLYFEGVTPGSEESEEKFNQAIGVEFNPELYDDLSLLFNVTAQDNNQFLGLVNDEDYNVDLSLDEVVNIYEEKTHNKLDIGLDSDSVEEQESPKTLNMSNELDKMLESISPRELALVQYFNQALMNTFMKHGGIQNFIVGLNNTDIFGVILDDRNKHLVDTIITYGDEKIIILYGLLHFNGVYELLRQADPNWQIVNTQEFQVIDQRGDGELPQ